LTGLSARWDTAIKKTLRASEQWNTAAVPLGALLFELKGGTWQPEASAPGVVIFDNFRAARP